MFLDNYGVELDDDSLQFPDNQNGGKEYVEGETKCPDGEDGELSVTVWESPEDTSDGRRYVSGFDDIRIDKNSLVFTIAFQPRGTDIGDAAVGRRPRAARRRRPGADRAAGQRAGERRPRGRADGHRRRRPDGRSTPTSTVGPDADDRCRHDHHGRLMHAVVLVGGFGTRLRPLTNTVPKSMLPIAHVPLIVRLIGQLERGGVDAVTLALGFLPEPFVEAFPDGRCGGVALDYAIEPEPLDTAGAIRFAADHAGIDDTFVVANGDVLTDLSIADLVGVHRAAERRGDDPPDPGRRPVGVRRRRARRRRSHPGASSRSRRPGTEPSNLINAGTYVFEPSVLDRIPPGRRVSIERDTFPLARRRRSLPRHGDRRLLDRRRAPRAVPAGQPRPRQRAAAPRSCKAGRRRRRRAPRRRRRRQRRRQPAPRVGAGATVTGSVLLPGAVVGGGAVVEDSIVAGAVGDGARVVRSVVGADAMIPDGEHVHDARIPEPGD